MIGMNSGALLSSSVVASQLSAAAAAGPSELLTNGSFTTGSDWTLNGGELMTISGGQLHGPGAVIEDQAYASQTIAAQTAGTFRFVYTIVSITVGSVQPRLDLGTFAGTSRTTAGTYQDDIVVTNGFTEVRLALDQGGDAVIDDASLTKVV